MILFCCAMICLYICLLYCIRTFQLPKHPSVPTCLDKWLLLCNLVPHASTLHAQSITPPLPPSPLPVLSLISNFTRSYSSRPVLMRSCLSLNYTQPVCHLLLLLLHTHLYPPSQSVSLVIPRTCVAYMTSMTCWRMGKPSFSWQISSISRSLLK